MSDGQPPGGLPRPGRDERAFRPARSRLPARLRHVRTAWLSRRIWRRRLILLFGAVFIGLAAVAFAWLADAANDLFRDIVELSPWAPLLLTPLAFGLSAAATIRWFDGAQGSGIPQVIAARASGVHAHRSALLNARVTIGKVVLTVLGMCAGGSIGREGPTVQVGAAIMFAVGGVAGIGRQRGLVLAGAAAGIAAAFNTPLAGVLFAIEELAKSFERRMAAITVSAVVLAGLTSFALVGDASYFGSVTLHMGTLRDWLAVPLCALVGGGLGGVFSRLLIVATRRAGRLCGLSVVRRGLFAAACGLAVAALALGTNYYAAGTSYAQTKLLLATGTELPAYYPLAKLASTLLSSVSGIPGGLFSPSLSVGAGLGSIVSAALPGVDKATIATLAMTAYFAGVVQSPLTAFVIVMEMTSTERASIPLMATALLAAGLSRLISREPVYHALALGYSDPNRFGRGRKRRVVE